MPSFVNLWNYSRDREKFHDDCLKNSDKCVGGQKWDQYRQIIQQKEKYGVKYLSCAIMMIIKCYNLLHCNPGFYMGQKWKWNKSVALKLFYFWKSWRFLVYDTKFGIFAFAELLRSNLRLLFRRPPSILTSWISGHLMSILRKFPKKLLSQ